MICKGCQHFATKTTPQPGQFLLYGCRAKKLNFGLWVDVKSGKANKEAGTVAVPKTCEVKSK